METLLLYVVKSSLLLMLFWSLYRMVLQREIFFKFNRFFLLTGLFVAVVLPLVKVHYPVEVVAAPQSVVAGVVSTVTDSAVAPQMQSARFWLWNYWGYILYGLIVCVLLVTRIWGICRLLGTAVRSRNCCISGWDKQVESKDIKTPFSFFGYVFLPDRGISDSEKHIILKHEQAHIAQRHWADLWLADLLCVVVV